jgi:hypothetical protein
MLLEKMSNIVKKLQVNFVSIRFRNAILPMTSFTSPLTVTCTIGLNSFS